MRPQASSTRDWETLHERTFYGKEKKSLAYVLGVMNMILHGIPAPNIVHTNTLAENLADIQEKDRFDVILANPPFGGKERKEIQQNFPIKTGETAFLFLQHFIKSLKAGGRAAIVIKNTFLSNTDNASVALRKELLEACNLHTVLDMPGGTFQGAGVKTVVLFFEKGAPTRKTWFYKLDPGRNLGKTNAAQRCRPGGVRRVAGELRRQRELLDGGAVEHRSPHLRPFGEEPEQGGGGRAARPEGDHCGDGGAGCGERGDPQEDRGDAVNRRRDTQTGGRDATTRHIFGRSALSVGMPSVAAPPGWRWVALDRRRSHGIWYIPEQESSRILGRRCALDRDSRREGSSRRNDL